MLLLAVSGGIDSMCMAEKVRLNGGPFAIAHCNFGLRGADSDADEALVREWAARYGISCHVKRFDTTSYAASRGVSIEMAARELRYRWFGELCREFGYEAVAVAHNADDNAETMLLNLVRGSGVKGLLGMRPEGRLPVPEYADIPLLRPILGLSRAEIAAFVAEHGVPYREDRTNAESDYKRNKLRNQVFPVLREINPSILGALERGREHLGEVEAIAEEYYQAHRDAVWDGVSVDLAALLSLEHPDYVLYRLLEEEGFASYTIEKVKSVLHDSATRSGRKVVEGDREIVFSSGRMQVRPLSQGPLDGISAAEDFAVVRAPGLYRVGLVSLEVSLHVPAEFSSFKTAPGETLLDAAALPFPFVARPVRPGDYLIPLGMRGRKKVSDLLSGAEPAVKERAVALLKPGWEKRGVAVSAPDTSAPDTPEPGSPTCDRIAALVGIRPDTAFRVTSSTSRILRISIKA